MSHVTGIACGNGLLSHGIYSGTMPRANIVSIKILDRNGQGNSMQAVRAMRWILEHARQYNIRVVNLSIGTNDHRSSPPLQEAAEKLWKAGIVVVAAAGNPDEQKGYRPPPPVSNGVITAGAWEDRNFFSTPSFSRFTKEDFFRPDFWAPGDDIISVLSPDYNFSLPGRSRKNIVSNHYIRMSGASMATPFISGAAALLLEQNPRAKPAEIKKLLLIITEPSNGFLNKDILQEHL